MSRLIDYIKRRINNPVFLLVRDDEEVKALPKDRVFFLVKEKTDEKVISTLNDVPLSAKELIEFSTNKVGKLHKKRRQLERNLETAKKNMESLLQVYEQLIEEMNIVSEDITKYEPFFKAGKN